MRLPFLALGALLASAGLAQNLSSPRIQVVRVGNGTDALSPMGNPVFIEEYKTLVGSEVVASTMLPTSEGLVIPGSDGLAGGGSSTFRGLFNVVGGYETSVTSGTLGTSVPAVVNRSVGLFGFDRYFEPTFFTDGFENGMVTGAVSNGIDRVFLSGRGTAAGLRMGLRGLTQTSTSIYAGNPDINRVRYAYSGDIMATSFNPGGIGAGIHEYQFPVNGPQTPTSSTRSTMPSMSTMIIRT